MNSLTVKGLWKTSEKLLKQVFMFTLKKVCPLGPSLPVDALVLPGVPVGVSETPDIQRESQPGTWPRAR